jgi:uncharacterized protein YciI
MFIVQLKFSSNKASAPQHMKAHKAWLARGFDDGVFLLAGSIEPGLGGAIIAHKILLSELQARVKEDPFVAGNVVTAEIIEIEPSRADERLQFLLD